MKRFNILSLLLLCIFCLSAQKGVHLEIQKLEKKKDSLTVDYQLHIIPHAIESGQGLYISPEIQSDDSAFSLPTVTILGKNKQKVLARFGGLFRKDFISAAITNDTVLIYHVKIPYALWMDSAGLIFNQRLAGYRNNSVLTTYKLSDSVNLSSCKLYRVSPVLAFLIPEKEVKHRKCQGEIHIGFQQGCSLIQPDYNRNAEELMKIDSIFCEVVSNPDVILQGLCIGGYGSPDGLYTANECLSKKRAQVLKDYIQNKFNLNDSLFQVKSVAEDWQGLEVLVKACDIAQKDRILEIISTIGVFEGREAALMKLDKGVPYRLMSKEIFPQLRLSRLEYQIDYIVRDYDVEQTLALLDKNSGDLSQLELYNLAMTYQPGSKEYNRIFLEIIPKYFPEDQTANNNAAAILIDNGELVAAKRYLKKAGNTSSSINNQGIIYLLEGDIDKAEDYFRQAQNMGSKEAVANLKEAQAKR